MGLNVPIAIDAISLGMFQDYQNAVNDVEKIHAITGKPTDFIEKLKIETIQTMIDMFENGLKTGQPKEKFRFKKLGFIPDLSSMTLAEYIDIDTFAKEVYKDGDLVADNLVKLLSVLYRPVKIDMKKFYRLEAYDSDSSYTYEDQIRELPMDVVHGALLFFSHLEKELLQNSLSSLTRELNQMTN